MICIVDMLIAAVYNHVILQYPVDKYTENVLTEIWIRPTITYGFVACFVSETEGVGRSFVISRYHEEQPWWLLFVVSVECIEMLLLALIH